MARGSIVKKEITDKILEVFPKSFLYNNGKEIRICGIEDGEEIQVKVTLTAAKVNVEPGDENKIPEPEKPNVAEQPFYAASTKDTVIEPTEEEKANVKKLLSSLGL